MAQVYKPNEGDQKVYLKAYIRNPIERRPKLTLIGVMTLLTQSAMKIFCK